MKKILIVIAIIGISTTLLECKSQNLKEAYQQLNIALNNENAQEIQEACEKIKKLVPNQDSRVRFAQEEIKLDKKEYAQACNEKYPTKHGKSGWVSYSE